MTGRTDGAGPPPGRRGTRLWWWVPVAVLAVVVAVILVRGGGDDDGPGTVPDTPSLEPARPEQEPGAMTIGGEPARPLLEIGDLSPRAGEEVLGTLVPVDSTIAQGVFWVGEGRAQILLLEPEDDSSTVAPGELVTFRGRLRELDDEARNAVWGAEAEPRIEAQGVYVAVDELVVGES